MARATILVSILVGLLVLSVVANNAPHVLVPVESLLQTDDPHCGPEVEGVAAVRSNLLNLEDAFSLGHEVHATASTDHLEDAALVDLSLTFPESGVLCFWALYTDQAGYIDLGVYERTSKQGTFRLKQQDHFLAGKGLQVCRVRQAHDVNPDDFVGWSVPKGGAALSYTTLGPGQVRFVQPSPPMKLGKEVLFPNTTKRTYALAATYKQNYAGMPLVCFPPAVDDMFKAGSCYGKIETPDPPSTKERTAHSLRVEWQELPDCDVVEAYRLEMAIPGSAWHDVYSGMNREALIENLIPSTHYQFRLSIISPHHFLSSDPSDIATLATDPVPPEQPAAPDVAANAREATVRWRPPPSSGLEIVGYMLFLDKGHGFELAWKGTEREMTLHDLVPNHSYMVKVMAANTEGESIASPEVSFMTATAPPNPPNVVEDSKGSRSMVLRWDKPESFGEEITKYALEYESQSGDGWVRIYEGPALSFPFTGLDPDTPYDFRMAAENARGWGPFSARRSFVTNPAAPQAPEPAYLLGRTQTSLHLGWRQPAANGAPITSYKLEMKHGPTTWIVAYEGPNTNATISELAPVSPCTFRLYATNDIGQSNASVVFSFQTSEGPPETPSAPLLVSKTDSGMTLQWNAPMDRMGVSEFRLEQAEGHPGDNLVFAEVYKGPANTATANGLDPEKWYTFRIQAVNPHGASDWSDFAAYKIHSDVPPAVSDPELVDKTAHILSMRWSTPETKPGLEVTMFEVWVQKGEMGMIFPFQRIYAASDPYFEATKLSPATDYHFKIRALNAHGPGEFSPIVSFTTLPSFPEPPEPPRLVAKTDTSLTVEWDPPHDNGAPIKRYTLRQGSAEDLQHAEPADVHDGAETHFTLVDLEPSKPYLLQVQAVNEHGASPFSEFSLFTTDGGIPSTPQAPSLLSAQAHSVSVEWEAALDNGSPVTEYRLEVRLEAGGTFQEAYTGPDRVATIGHLMPAQSVWVRVMASNMAGSSDVSPEAEVRTAAGIPAAPFPPTLVEPRGRSLVLQWNEPETHGAPVIEYRLEKDDGHGEVPVFDEVFRGNKTQTVVSSLVPLSTYHFRVCAVNSEGVGPWSEVAEHITRPAAPDAPSMPKVVLVPATEEETVEQDTEDQGILSAGQEDGEEGEGEDEGEDEGEASPVSMLQTGVRVPSTDVESDSAGDPMAPPAEFIPAYEGQPPAASKMVGQVASQLVQWDLPESNGADIERFEVELSRGCDDTTWESVKQGSQEWLGSREAVVHKLEREKQHCFRVRAISAFGTSPWSPVGKRLQHEITPPSEPDQPVQNKTDGHSMWIKIREPRDNSYVGTLEVHIAEGEGAFSLLYRGNCHHHPCIPFPGETGAYLVFVGGLKPVTTYRFKTRARNAAGQGGFGVEAFLTSGSSRPGTPPPPEVVAVSRDAVTLRMSPPEDTGGSAVTSWKVYRNNVLAAEVSTTEVDLSELSPATTSSFTVEALNKGGVSDRSDPVDATTSPAEPGPLLPPKLVQVTATTIKLGVSSLEKLDTFGSPVSSFEFQCQRSSAPETWVTACQGMRNECIVRGLELEMEYECRVRAGNRVGMGDWSDSVTTTTKGPLYVSLDGHDFNDGSGADKTKALRTLKVALERADDGGVIVLGAGLFKGKGFNNLAANIPVTIRGDPKYSVVDCDGQPFVRLGAGGQLESFTLQNCYAAKGAVYLGRGSDALISRMRFLDNAGRVGGAVFAFQMRSLLIEDTVFEKNVADSHGGGLGLVGCSNVLVHGTTFQDNRALESGGGTFSWQGLHQAYSECSFVGNQASSAGGLRTHAVQGVVVKNTVFRANQAEIGGGEVHTGSGQVVLLDSPHTNNVALKAGGGLAMGDLDPNSLVTNCAFMNNTAIIGGGLLLYGSETAHWEKVTVQDNISHGWEKRFREGVYIKGEGLGVVFADSILTDGVRARDAHVVFKSVVLDEGKGPVDCTLAAGEGEQDDSMCQ